MYSSMYCGTSKVGDVNGCHNLPASRGGEVGMGGDGGAVFCVGAMCDVDGEKNAPASRCGVVSHWGGASNVAGGGYGLQRMGISFSRMTKCARECLAVCTLFELL